GRSLLHTPLRKPVAAARSRSAARRQPRAGDSPADRPAPAPAPQKPRTPQAPAPAPSSLYPAGQPASWKAALGQRGPELDVLCITHGPSVGPSTRPILGYVPVR